MRCERAAGWAVVGRQARRRARLLIHRRGRGCSPRGDVLPSTRRGAACARAYAASQAPIIHIRSACVRRACCLSEVCAGSARRRTSAPLWCCAPMRWREALMRNVPVSQHLAARTPTDTLRRPAVLFQKPARHWQRPTHKRCEAAAPSKGLTWCTIAGTQARPAWHHGTPTSDQRTAPIASTEPIAAPRHACAACAGCIPAGTPRPPHRAPEHTAARGPSG